MKKNPDIYRYEDYRLYLKDWFEARAGRPSKRAFAAKVVCSPALISAVLTGDRDLNDHLAERIASLVTNDEKERAYFLDMVTWAQPGPAQRRREAHERMDAARRYQAARRIQGAMDLLFSKWYHPVISELAHCAAFREDPEWIARTLRPPITPEEATAALALLQETGFLVRSAEGRLAPPAPNFVTEHQLPPASGATLAAMHRWLLRHAADALDLFPQEQRHFGTMSIAIPAERLGELKEFIEAFTEGVMGRFSTGEAADQVVQVSIQLYPVTAAVRS